MWRQVDEGIIFKLKTRVLLNILCESDEEFDAKGPKKAWNSVFGDNELYASELEGGAR